MSVKKLRVEKSHISFILKYGGLGLLLSVAIYAYSNGLDIKSSNMLFLALSFIVSSFFWR